MRACALPAASWTTLRERGSPGCRGKVRVPVDADQAAVEQAARADSSVAGYLSGKTVVKVIFVPGRLLNFVVK